MAVKIKPEAIKEIAVQLETGMICFYHKITGEIEYYPDEFRNSGYDQEQWLEVIDKINENYGDYLRFEGMRSSEAFKVMEYFIDDISHIPTHNKFINAISRKKPFGRFNDLLQYYPDLRKQWFAYKLEAYTKFVKNQLPLDEVY
ncbi:MAG: hypothetical protein JST32_19970 [Bacteroidetes bacterium]|nr:hypothetical protein [Bacteroidota bacterium]